MNIIAITTIKNNAVGTPSPIPRGTPKSPPAPANVNSTSK